MRPHSDKHSDNAKEEARREAIGAGEEWDDTAYEPRDLEPSHHFDEVHITAVPLATDRPDSLVGLAHSTLL